MIEAVSTALEVIDCCRPLGGEVLEDEEAATTARMFKALADPARVKIVNRLAQSEEPVCVCEFMPILGLSQATVSHHLTKLTRVGLLEREQCGKWAYFSLNPETAERLAGIVEFQEVAR
jgi:ArsR family transcriptional regulator, arsenate/arsenite/antimonite-responsive transcriptional repressor